MQNIDVEPRADKSLADLKAEWYNCEKCALGKQRAAVNGNMVFGEGSTKGIMFIGGGPGEVEEEQGRPFVGPSGNRVLRPILEEMGIKDISYITNLVACRSCTQQHDNAGQPIFQRNRYGAPLPKWQDEDPPAPCINTCLPRLIEEIYIVDPLIIVAMGVPAVETLRGKPVSLLKDQGIPEEISIPGATFEAVLTEKRQAWLRIKDGKPITPTVRSSVRYLMIPTTNPAFVARNLTNQSADGPLRKLADNIHLVAQVYERYQLEIEGVSPSSSSKAEVQDEQTQE